MVNKVLVGLTATAAAITAIITIMSGSSTIIDRVLGDGPRATIGERKVGNVDIHSGGWVDFSGLSYSILEYRNVPARGMKVAILHRNSIIFSEWFSEYEHKALNVGNCHDLRLQVSDAGSAYEPKQKGKAASVDVTWTTLRIETNCSF